MYKNRGNLLKRLLIILVVVSAFNTNRERAFSSEPTPQDLRVIAVSSGSFTVAWDNPVTAANRLWIGSSVINIAELSDPTIAVTYNFSSLPSTAYIIKVMLYTTEGASSFTPPIRVNTRQSGGETFSKPHDRFNDNNSSCKACHSIHVARSQTKLLFYQYNEDTTSYTTESIILPDGSYMSVKRPRVDLCFNCHDGTGADNNIKSLFDNAISEKGDFPGHVTKVTGTYNGIGWKGNIKGMPARTQLPCLACHDVHSSNRRGSNGQRGNTKNIADFLVTYASLTTPWSRFGNSKGNWIQTDSASTVEPYQYNYPPYEVVNTTGFGQETQGNFEKCTVCHHGDKEGDMIVAGLDEWLPTVAYKDTYGVTVSAHTDRKTCDCHVGTSYNQSKPNVHTLAKKPFSPVTNCAMCHTIVYDYMKATGAYGTSGHSSRNFHHPISASPNDVGKTNAVGVTTCTGMCHSDHGRDRRPSDAYVLWTEVSTSFNPGVAQLPYQTSANTDYIWPNSAGYSTQGGLCTSCHQLRQRSHSTESAVFIQGTQPTNANESSGRWHSTISPTVFATSAHNFTMTISYGGLNGANQDGSWFQHNCTKCHRDNRTVGYDTGTPIGSWSRRAFRGPHASDYNSMLVATTALGRQEQTCFGTGIGLQRTGCHGEGRSPSYLNLEQLFTSSAYGPNRGHAIALVSTAVDNRHLGLAQPGSYNDAAGTNRDRLNPNNTAAGPATRHVECQDCHNPHEVTTQAYLSSNQPTFDSQTSGYFYGRSQLHIKGSDAIGGANFGVWGVEPDYNDASFITTSPDYYYSTGAVETAFIPVYPATKQYQLCFKCHTAYAYGRYQPSRPYVPSPTGVPRAGSFGSTSPTTTQTDISQDFNPANYGYHPIVTYGRNQPLKHLGSSYYNSNWPEWDGNDTGSPLVTVTGVTASFSSAIPSSFYNYYARPGIFLATGSASPGNPSSNWLEVMRVLSPTQVVVKSPATTSSNITFMLNSGFNATFIAPYGPRGHVVCTDCHSPPDGTSEAQGPHGSQEKWLLRRVNTSILVDSGVDGSINDAINSGATSQILCWNCHRRDVYGQSSQGSHACWSRLGDSSRDCNDVRGHPDPEGGNSEHYNNGLNAWNIFCLNCHGGSLGSIHGSAHGRGGNGSSNLGVRLSVGAARFISGTGNLSVGGLSIGTSQDTCYTKGSSDTVSNCTEHSGGDSRSVPTIYDYTGAP